jgi:hypothetical protein
MATPGGIHLAYDDIDSTRIRGVALAYSIIYWYRAISRNSSRARCNVPAKIGHRCFVTPNQVILAVPDRYALRVLHPTRITPQSPKGEGFTDPLSETLKWNG